MTMALDPASLRRLLTANGVDVRGELEIAPISGGRSNLTFKVSDGHGTWVARRPPLTGLTTSAHDVVREYRVIEALRSTAVPVPDAVACDADGTVTGSPLCVVSHLPGLAIRDQHDLAALTDVQVQAMSNTLVDTLVALHAVDYRSVGLETLGRPSGFAARQVRTWARQWHAVKTRDLPDVDRLIDALQESTFPEGSTAIVHGDFRVDNTLLDPASPDVVLGVVDWEMSTLGDPLTDLALTYAYRSPAFDDVLGAAAAWTSPRLPDAVDLADRYARTSERELAGWNLYLALANLKIAVIAEGIAHRSRSATDARRTDRPELATPVFAAEGLSALQAV
jgi:aminoglycoside phosphotransferase (APT) family kinase protein